MKVFLKYCETVKRKRHSLKTSALLSFYGGNLTHAMHKYGSKLSCFTQDWVDISFDLYESYLRFILVNFLTKYSNSCGCMINTYYVHNNLTNIGWSACDSIHRG